MPRYRPAGARMAGAVATAMLNASSSQRNEPDGPAGHNPLGMREKQPWIGVDARS